MSDIRNTQNWSFETKQIHIGQEKAFIIGSCKFKNEKIGIDEYERLKHYAAVFGKRGTYHYYIFSKGGFTDGLIEKAKADDVRLVTLDEMYENG